jgi:hypothetical protein
VYPVPQVDCTIKISVKVYVFIAENRSLTVSMSELLTHT